MRPLTRVVHRTKERLRLRIPGRRKDMDYFLDLYDDLRQIRGVTEVVINPLTASVLLNFHPEAAGQVVDSLAGIGLLPQKEVKGSKQPVPGAVERFFANHQSAATDVRTVILTLMIGIAIHQALRGKILAPALSALWYAFDLIAAHRREKELLDAPAVPTSDPPDS